MIVVDGLQRLTTFQRFLDDDLKLRLPGRPDLHGKRFSELGRSCRIVSRTAISPSSSWMRRFPTGHVWTSSNE